MTKWLLSFFLPSDPPHPDPVGNKKQDIYAGGVFIDEQFKMKVKKAKTIIVFSLPDKYINEFQQIICHK